MPYPNFHSCRLRDPNDFQPRMATIKRGSVFLIIGKLKGKTTTTAQAIRYPKDDWSADDARADCEKQGGSFEAARKAK